MHVSRRLLPWIALFRLDKPIGIYLLLWPTLCALWLSANGLPQVDVLIIFVVGVLIMRSAGCAINDIWDYDIDKHVARTKDRPVTSGVISRSQALYATMGLCMVAFLLVLMTNVTTVLWSFGALASTIIYPLMKRVIASLEDI